MKKIGIIGGGACGLFAAIELKKNLGDEISIDIIEKNNKVGKKILMSGNGRCNFSNMNVNPLAYNNPDFVKPIISNCPPVVLQKWFENLGVVSQVDLEGRVYPYTDAASSCLEMLLLPLKYSNVRILTEVLVDKIEYRYNKYRVSGENFEEKYDILIIATGSNAGEKIKRNPIIVTLIKMGYQFTKMVPALGPIMVNEEIQSLKGIRVQAKATLIINDKTETSEGEILFKEDSLSGIAIFELSSYLARTKVLDKPIDKCKVYLDLMPKVEIQELRNQIMMRRIRFSQYALENIVRGMFNKMVAAKIYQRSGLKLGSRLCGSLTDEEIGRLVSTIKQLPYTVNVQKNSDIYQVISGGIELSQVERRTLESRKHPNLYFGGEILDIDGECGGYNLHFAFASGYQIAKSIILKVKDNASLS